MQFTPREREVLAELAGGLSNKEVAQRLGIEPSTVENHLNHIFRKLGAQNRTQAVVLAIRHGLITVGTNQQGCITSMARSQEEDHDDTSHA